MFRKLKNWFRNDRSMRSTSTIHIFEEVNDPRELPRPHKSDLLDATTSPAKERSEVDSAHAQCNCKNNREVLDTFSECTVCLEPLQGIAICSCLFCGNFICWGCSDKVSHCPFCRAPFIGEQNRIRNFALERVLNNLILPCRHARWGCPIQLTLIERTSHEVSCMFAPSGCPLVKLCGWHGDTIDIARHLRDCHDMTLVAANGINVEISDFRKKLMYTYASPRLYTVSLTCHGNIYICKLKMVKQQLRLVFYQITGELSPKDQRFAACLEVSTCSRKLQGTVEISPKHRNNKDIVIPGQSLIYSTSDGDDLVKINITIKPILP